jgi:hypothetical protein
MMLLGVDRITFQTPAKEFRRFNQMNEKGLTFFTWDQKSWAWVQLDERPKQKQGVHPPSSNECLVISSWC